MFSKFRLIFSPKLYPYHVGLEKIFQGAEEHLHIPRFDIFRGFSRDAISSENLSIVIDKQIFLYLPSLVHRI